MNYLPHMLLLLGAVIGTTKAHHFIKLVILAALGLAGLWMVHTLAQDYGNITHGGGKLLEKRSVDSQEKQNGINWEFVLSRDPARCARSYICQLAAQDETQLDDISKNILKLTRRSTKDDSWASRQLSEALEYGEGATAPTQCRKLYKLCPYSSQMMTTLLKLFGG